jgi:hypothetical protein
MDYQLNFVLKSTLFSFKRRKKFDRDGREEKRLGLL